MGPKPGQTLHFPDSDKPKIASINKCPLYQRTTHFLCKHVKIASLCKCPLYQNTTLLLVKRPPYQSLHFVYAKSQKLRAYTNVHYINHYTLQCKHVKIASIS